MRPTGVLQQLQGLTMAGSFVPTAWPRLTQSIEKTHCGIILQFVNITWFASIANAGMKLERR